MRKKLFFKKFWVINLIICCVVFSFFSAPTFAATVSDETYDSYRGTPDEKLTENPVVPVELGQLKYTLTGSYRAIEPRNYDDPDPYLGNNNDDYYLEIVGDTVKIEAVDGSSFKLNGFEMYAYSESGANIEIVSSATSTKTTLAPHSTWQRVSVDLSSNSDYGNITSFTISGDGMVFHIDDIDFGDPVVPSHTITYNANGESSGSAPSNQSVNSGDSATLATNAGSLTRSGYSLSGWNTANDGTGTHYDLGGNIPSVSSDVTLYAEWQGSITYNANSATSGSVPSAVTVYANGGDITVSTNIGSLTRTGYSFTGWNTSSDGTGTHYDTGSSLSITGDVTLYAEWQGTVTYNANSATSGSVPSSVTVYANGSDITVSTNTGTLARTDYTFTGWNTSNDGTGTHYDTGSSLSITGDVTLYAEWQGTVTYNANSATSGSVPSSVTVYANGSDITVSTNTGSLVRTGYSFTGWNTSNDGTGTHYDTGSNLSITGDVTLYAEWQGTVTYNANNATSGSVPSSVTVYANGADISLSTNTGSLVRSGYIFTGWNISNDGTGTHYDTGSSLSIAGDVTLYAEWQGTVTYNANSATSGSVPSSVTVYANGGDITLSNNTGLLAKTGYSFTGWNTSNDGTGTHYDTGSSLSITGDVTLYAEWKGTVTYNANSATSGSVPSSVTVYANGGDITLSNNTGSLAKTGYSFTGWNTSNDGTGTHYDTGSNLSIIGDVTLYAEWQGTVTYNANSATSGSVPSAVTVYANGSDITLSNNTGSLAKTGYSFTGWNTSNDRTGTHYDTGSSLSISGDVTLYAEWQGTVTYNANSATSGSMPSSVTVYANGSDITLSNNTGSLARTGYTFAGWNTSNDGTGTHYDTGSSLSITGDVTLYAEWEGTVTYNGNSATSGSVPSAVRVYANGSDINVSTNTGTLAKTGYTFTGWNTSNDGTGTHYDTGSSLAVTGDVTLYAEWQGTVTYNANNAISGSVPSSVTVYANGSDITLSTNTGILARTGYTFTGWNTSNDGTGTHYDTGSRLSITGDITLYAEWQGTVTYNANSPTSGSVPLSVTVYANGSDITLSTNTGTLARTGYIFTGWNTSNDGTGTHYDVGANLSITGDVTLYAEWQGTVTYNANNATSGSVPSSITVYANGSDIAVSTNTGTLARTGYTFTGWNTSNDGTGTHYDAGSSLAVTGDVILYAEWKRTVTYNSNSATSGTVPSSQNVSDGGSVTLSSNTGSLTRTGYTFTGWNTLSNGTGTHYDTGSSLSITGSTTLYAEWQANYSVTYNENGATNGLVPGTESTYNGANVIVSTNTGSLTRIGYTFTGWNTSNDGTGTHYDTGSSLSITGDVTLYAEWQGTVAYNANSATSGSVPSSVTVYANGSDITVSTNTGLLTRTGYTFTGWNTSNDGTGTHYDTGSNLAVTGDVTLYAEWQGTVTYNANSATSGSVPSSVTVYANGSDINVSTNTGTLARTGYIFTGWNTSNDGTGTHYDTGSSLAVTGDVTLYAEWQGTVTYNANNATSGSLPSTVTVYANESDITLSTNTGTLARTGYSFTGWNTSNDGTGTHYDTGSSLAVTGDVTLYAEWQGTVTYNANSATSGSVPSSVIVYANGSDITLSTNTGTLARTGYTFTGWNTSNDGTGTHYDAGSNLSITGDLTLYAEWQATVTYNANNASSGSVPSSVIVYANGADIVVSNNTGTLARTGYSFTGWNTSNDGTGTHYDTGSNLAVTGDVTLYAEWQGTVAYNANSATSGSVPSSVTVYANGSDITLSTNTGTLARTGYSFTGWNTSNDGTGTHYDTGSSLSITGDVILYAEWKRTVTYNANSATSGTVPSSQNVSDGGSVTLSSNTGTLTRTGYTFTGWNTLSNGTGTHYDTGSSLLITGSTTLYAEWQANYSVTYNENGATNGLVPSTESTYNGANIIVSANTGSLTRTGYTFTGWNTSSDGTGTHYDTGSNFVVTGDVTLYAEWQGTVTYNANNATSGSVPSSITVYANGSDIAVSTNTGTLARTGYTFTGWNTSSDGTGTHYDAGSSLAVTGDVILYAEWKRTVTYNSNSATSGTVPSSQNVSDGGSVTLSSNTGSLTRTGYTFTGWNTLSNGTGTHYDIGSSLSITGSTTLYAEWQANYSVTYNENGATSGLVPSTASTYNGANLIVSTNTGTLARTGYTFTGWNTSSDGSGTHYDAGSSLAVTGDVTLYAEWQGTVTYNANSATSGSVPSAVAIYANGSDITLSTNTGSLARFGYTFTGWNTSNDGTGTHYDTGSSLSITGDVTLYAEWQGTVAYNANSATSGSVPSSVTVYANRSDITVSTNTGLLTRTGYTFTGWNTSNDGTGTHYDTGSSLSITGDVTLYAEWQGIVTYNANSATSGSVPSSVIVYANGSDITLSTNTGTLARTGYTFTGWNTSSDGTGTHYDTGSNLAVTSDMTLYAEWQGTVTYNANSATSGSLPSSVIVYANGSDITLSTNTGTLARTGYTFTGWNTSSDGTGTHYDAGSSLAVTGNMTLYAEWQGTVTYDTNSATSGSVPLAVTVYANGSDINVSTNTGTLARTGYTFTGWNTSNDGTGTHYDTGSSLSITGDITLYAEWQGTVTYNANSPTSGSVPSSVTVYANGSDITLSTNTGILARTGYTFTGWNTSNDGTGTHYDTGSSLSITGDVTLYAEWQGTVTYNANNATSGSAPSSVTVYGNGSDITLSTNTGTLARTGYTFTGWNTLSNGTGTHYDTGSSLSITGSTILYAEWQANYSITYNENGATNGLVPSTESTYNGTNVIVSNNTGSLTRTGYTFTGWNTSSDGTGTHYDTGSNLAVTGDVTLYAEWQGTVAYNANSATSGSVPSSVTVYANGSDIAVSNNIGTLTRTGYTFTGWNTLSNGTGTHYDTGSSLLIMGSTTLYAEWQANYSITYNENGATNGLVPSTESTYNGANLIVSTNTGTLARTGYTFTGWNTSNDGSGTHYDVGSSLAVTGDVTLYAEWQGTVTYNANSATSGSVPSAVTVYANSSAISLSANTGSLMSSGYTFTGWNTSSDGTGSHYDIGSYLSITGDVILYAEWQANYSTTYSENGATSGTVPSTESTYNGASVMISNNIGSLARTNYTFTGWNTKSDGTGIHYNGGDQIKITGNMILYAEWKSQPTYSVTYNINGGTGTVPSPSEDNYVNTSVTVSTGSATVVKAGYTFTGWNTKSDGTGIHYNAGDQIKITGNVSLYAEWKSQPTYSVSYNINGGTGTVPSVSEGHYVNTNVTVSTGSATIIKVGYTFTGWNTESDGTGSHYNVGDQLKITGNVILYAEWKSQPTYSVSYNINGGTGTVPSVSEGHYVNTNVTVSTGSATIIKVGYTFTGWNTESDGTGSHYNVGDQLKITGNVTLYAEWKSQPTYSVSYNINGGTGTVPSVSEGHYVNTNVTVSTGSATIIKAGYTFTGWNTESDATGNHYNVGDKITIIGDITLYAEWMAQSTYSIFYNSNGGTGTLPTTSTGHYSGEKIKISKESILLVKNGHTFAGWNTNFNGSGKHYNPGDEIVINENVTLYAEWTALPTYSLSYNSNGGTGEVPSSSTGHYIDENVIVSDGSTILTKSGFNFIGWNTAPDGSGNHYNAGEQIKIIEDLILYAEWQKIETTDNSNSKKDKDNEEEEEEEEQNSESITATSNNDQGVEVIVNGEKEKVGTLSSKEESGQVTTTVRVTLEDIEEKLNQEESIKTITIPVVSEADVAVGELTGDAVKAIENGEGIVEIRTENVSYSLPAKEINISEIFDELGENIKLEEVKVSITVAESTKEEVEIIEDAANAGKYQVVMQPIDFTINCSYEDKTVEIHDFNTYVERKIAIPANIDPSKITTAIVLGEDGALHHVPTKISIIDGQYYAQVNSLTNSSYTLVYSPIEFEDVEKHWGKDIINEMGSRLVVKGTSEGIFEPDRVVTRAEFVTLVTRGLGVNSKASYTDIYSDVGKDDWYACEITTATKYKLLSQYTASQFEPSKNMTREEAIVIIASAIANVSEKQSTEMTNEEVDAILELYLDDDEIAEWACSKMSYCVREGVVKGHNKYLKPKENITRAEATVLIMRMLEVLDLI